MSVGQGIEQRPGQGESAIRIQRPTGSQQLGEGLPLDEGHGVVHQPLAISHEVNRQNVRVIEPGNRSRLVLEAVQHAGGPCDVGLEYLDRKPPLEVLVPDLIHLGETTLPQQATDFVLLTQRPGEAFLYRYVGRERRRRWSRSWMLLATAGTEVGRRRDRSATGRTGYVRGHSWNLGVGAGRW